MPQAAKYLFLNLPNPPGTNIYRGFAGGFGTAGSAGSPVLLPVFLLYAASAAITSGCNFRVLDAQALRYSVVQLLDFIQKESPDILVSWVSLPSFNHDVKILERIKKTFPGMLVIVLGTVCNVLPEEVLQKSSADLVIRGRYPYHTIILKLIDILRQNPLNQRTFEMLGALYLKDGKMVQTSDNNYDTGKEDLDCLSLVAYYRLPLNRYLADIPDARGNIHRYIPLLSSTGCPYSCIYCPYPVGYGRTVVLKSVDCITREIEFLKKRFGISCFMFRDQVFSHDKNRVSGLCDELIEKQLNVKWFAEGRVDELSESLIQKMKKAGCIGLHLGVETGSPEQLRKVGKPGVRLETIRNTFMTAKKHGISTTAFMIIGLPGEDRESISESLNLLREIRADHANINVATPYPGTPLFNISREEGRISTFDWSRYTSYNAILDTGSMSAAEVNLAAKNLANSFHRYKLMSDSGYRKYYARELIGDVLNRLKLYQKTHRA